MSNGNSRWCRGCSVWVEPDDLRIRDDGSGLKRHVACEGITEPTKTTAGEHIVLSEVNDGKQARRCTCDTGWPLRVVVEDGELRLRAAVTKTTLAEVAVEALAKLDPEAVAAGALAGPEMLYSCTGCGVPYPLVDGVVKFHKVRFMTDYMECHGSRRAPLVAPPPPQHWHGNVEVAAALEQVRQTNRNQATPPAAVSRSRLEYELVSDLRKGPGASSHTTSGLMEIARHLLDAGWVPSTERLSR